MNWNMFFAREMFHKVLIITSYLIETLRLSAPLTLFHPFQPPHPISGAALYSNMQNVIFPISLTIKYCYKYPQN